MEIAITQEGKIPVARGGLGLLIGDVNYGLDGGLYAELLENRNFESKKVYGERGDITVEDDGGYAWEVYPAGADVALKIKTDRALFPENPHYMRIAANEAGAGMKNKAYDGVYLTKGMGYQLSFYARSYDYKGAALAGVYQNGVPLIEKKVKLKADGKWRKYSFRLKSKADAERADFAFTLCKAGMVHADCFSLMPENAVLGVFRRDLVELMKELKPGFLRFPGGCGLAENGYLWKNSIGQTERRKHNWNGWALYGAERDKVSPYSHYGQTLGIGFFEYFRLSEYLGAKPLPVVSANGNQLSARAGFETFVQDALDVIEFANGGTDTVWGRVRAEMGHAQPFGLDLLGLDVSEGEEFFGRASERVAEKYPDLKIVAVDGKETAPGGTRKRAKRRSGDFSGYAAEERFCCSPALCANGNAFGACGGKVYAATYGARGEGECSNPWETALAAAAFMTEIERNAAVAVMSSYAPLFARSGYTQWEPALVCFDGKKSFAAADYYVQKLYSLYAGDFSLRVSKEEGERVYVSAAEREGMTFVKIVNAGEEPAEAEITGDYDFGSLTRIIRMEGEAGDRNTAEEPFKIIPLEIAPAAARSLALPPRSFNVLVFMK